MAGHQAHLTPLSAQLSSASTADTVCVSETLINDHTSCSLTVSEFPFGSLTGYLHRECEVCEDH